MLQLTKWSTLLHLVYCSSKESVSSGPPLCRTGLPMVTKNLLMSIGESAYCCFVANTSLYMYTCLSNFRPHSQQYLSSSSSSSESSSLKSHLLAKRNPLMKTFPIIMMLMISKIACLVSTLQVKRRMTTLFEYLQVH